MPPPPFLSLQGSFRLPGAASAATARPGAVCVGVAGLMATWVPLQGSSKGIRKGLGLL